MEYEIASPKFIRPDIELTTLSSLSDNCIADRNMIPTTIC